MPAYDYAVLVHNARSDKPLNTDVVEGLKEEEFLLVESCEIVVDTSKEQVFGKDGKNLLTVYSPGQLSWNVNSLVLDYDGLADFHPGAALTRRLLPCANAAARRPFQFAEGGVLVFESPRLTQGQGTLPGIAFTIAEVLGEGLDETAYPDISGSVTVPTADLAAQTAVELSTAARTALLTDVFNGVDAFNDEDVLVRLYAGAPSLSGVALTGSEVANAWANLDEPTLVYQTRARNSAAITWTDTEPYERVATHARVERNGVVLRDIEFSPPLTIPPGTRPKIPINALGLLLTWPFDGVANPPTAADRPSRHFLAYVMGGARASYITSSDFYITFSDDDFASPTDFDSIAAIPATSTYWTVSGLTVEPNFTGTNLAPGGGWAIESMKATIEGDTVVALRGLADLTTSAGSAVTVAGAPLLDLAAVPS